MEIGKIQPREITKELQESYLDYAMSVIVARALPDVRDGLKPVQRRILWSMWQEGLTSGAKFRKSATIIGAVLGRYHPHGDISVYDALVRMAQDFSLRYPLIDGQGNFGSIDGDSAAAYRYTEARLSKIAEELLKDIEKETVPFVDNYDGVWKEPRVLPAGLPNLLLAGSSGIAVGMATNIPPHNLSEVLEAAIKLLEKPNLDHLELMNIIQGPDFPTGGAIYNAKEISQAYASGRGPILMRGEAEIEETEKGGNRIVIRSVPYQVNKAVLVEKIADLVREKKIEGIRDLRDESDKEGMRVVAELKSDAQPRHILNQFYKYTELEKTFYLNMLALVDGIQPQILPLKSILEEYIKWREVVVRRRVEFDLQKAKDRGHILEGFKKALSHIDAIIETIKKSADREKAREALMKKFKFSEVQTEAILEMRLAMLAGLERKKIEDELAEKKRIIKELTEILESKTGVRGVIKKELVFLKEKYGDVRKTKVVKGAVKELSEEELVAKEEAIIVVTRGGYIKRIKPDAWRTQKRGGKGVLGMSTKEEDATMRFLVANTHDNLLFFTSRGKVYQTRVWEIPEGTRQAKGKLLVNFLNLSPDEKVTSILNYSVDEDLKVKYLVMATELGQIKKTSLDEFSGARRSGLIAIKLRKDDSLSWVKTSTGKDDLILVTKFGQSVRFPEKAVREMGRTASGVRGIRLKGEDRVVGLEVIDPAENKAQLLIITQNGFGKKTLLKEYRRQGRGGSGIKTAKITKKNGFITSAEILDPAAEDLIAISNKGQVIRIKLSSIPTLSRATQGVRIMKPHEGDEVASATVI
ncbi:MAG: DNA gyrase subunit A [Parcubacteria group bacterium]|nr:DNA gyrase subunit A [Parcubacteria group bacterium]